MSATFSRLAKRHDFRVRWINRYDPRNGLLRLIRIVWEHGRTGDTTQYSTKVTLGLSRRSFGWQREYTGWIIWLAFVRLHYSRSYGGIYV